MAIDEKYNYLDNGNIDGSIIGQSAAERVGFYGTTPIVQPSGAAQAGASAGGTGAAAGAYDTAAHRDAAIALLNEIRTVLVNLGLMKGGE